MTFAASPSQRRGAPGMLHTHPPGTPGPSPGRWSSAVCRRKPPHGSSVAVAVAVLGARRRGQKQPHAEGGGGAGSLPGQPSWARPRGRPTPGTKPRRGKRLDAGGRGVPAGCSLPAAPIATAARESRAFLCALTAGEKPRSSSAWGHMALNCPIWERQRRVAGRFGCKKGTRCLSRHIHQLSRGIYPDGPAGNPMQPRESLSAGSRASDGSRTGSSAPPPPLQPRSPGPARPGPGRRGTHPRRGQTGPGAPPLPAHPRRDTFCQKQPGEDLPRVIPLFYVFCFEWMKE